MKSLICRGRLIQYFVAFYANFGILSYSLAVGWISNNVSILTSEETPLISGPLSIRQISLLGSIIYLTAIPGSLLFGWLADRIGRKWSLYIGMLIYFVSFLLIPLSSSYTTLVIARALTGIACGCTFVVSPVFVSEIAEKEIRGYLGFIFNIIITTGISISWIICKNVTFNAAPFVFMALISTIFVVFLFVHESPQFLLLRGKEEEARDSLKFFRGVKKHQELPVQVQEEFEELKNSPTLRIQEEKISLEDLKIPAIRKAMMICCVVYAGKYTSGIQVIVVYLGSLFVQMNTRMDSITAALISVCFALPGSFLAFTVVESWGRKAVLVCSSILTAVSFVPVILILRFNHLWKLPDYLSILSVGLILLISSFGLIALPMQISAEILPPKLRSKVCAFMMIMVWIGMFIMANYFLPWSESLGMDVLICFFFLWCLFEGVFVWKLMPETKGKTYDEIAQAF
ncbi:solute carrier family 2, facilitated glucose transporter member 8-like isoform X2 [Lutzomyia longipalpis]|uniref:solute carrier family 2, facilitated glucose transporter member 8-like isoform X2 n=1 Tax=Lutzomyia longipalpis TaxID=7200 RepID=UPI002483315A|nr:solute carrier family 2, facilitated glucose transporter member 8-like isoform X2 [Lutzomyia longipalpis]